MRYTKSEISRIFRERLSLLIVGARIKRIDLAKTLNCSLSSINSKLTPSGKREFTFAELAIIESVHKIGIINIFHDLMYECNTTSVASPAPSVASPAPSVASPAPSVALHFPDKGLMSVINDDSVQASILNYTRLKKNSSEKRRENAKQDVLLAIEESGKTND